MGNSRGLFIFVFLSLLLLGCTFNVGITPPKERLSPEKEQMYFSIAKPKIENILNALDNGDYEAFSVDFSPKLKELNSNETFMIIKKMTGENGAYVSSYGKNAIETDGIVEIRFIAEYQRKKEIPVDIRLVKIDEEYFIDSFWIYPIQYSFSWGNTTNID